MSGVSQGLSALALAAIASCSDHAESPTTPGYTTVVDGISVYVGVVPSSVLRAHPNEHAERSMHDGARGSRGEHHVLVSFFDARTGTRLVNMDAWAKVGELGMSAAQKPLEPMQIGDTVTYGNFFSMPKPGPYSIELDWRTKNGDKWFHAVFTYRHPMR